MEEALCRTPSHLQTHGRPSLGTAALSFSAADCARVIAVACTPLSDYALPVTQWSTHLLGVELRRQQVVISERFIGRILRDADLQPHRQRMWLTSHDDEFRARRDEILHLYYDTPHDQPIVCLDEKTSIQALERCVPDVPMQPGQPVRREFEYIRHGTVCFHGAYDVRLGKLFGFFDAVHNGDTFVALLDYVNAVYPDAKKGHLVCDNLSSHLTEEVLEWLEDHPRWTLHLTPTHASWLNQIECAFSRLSKEVLQRGSFVSVEKLVEAVEAWLVWRNETSQPFVWTYRPKSWDRKPALTSAYLN